MPDMLGEVLVARQPIVDANLEVVAYELLYRDVEGRAPSTDPEGMRATASVLVDGLLALGRDVVTDGEDAFVNLPRQLLETRILLDIPPRGIVFELLDDIDDSADLRTAIADHQAEGFRFALDKVVPDDPRLSLSDVVDVIKVDVDATGPDPALRFIRELAGVGFGIVAEKVEDPVLFDRVIGAGASMVQGFFFTRPRAVRALRPVGLAPTHLQLLQALTKEEVDLRQVERLIRTDLTLSDRFLRLVQLAAGWRPVESIHHGLVLLGQRAVHRWVTLLVMSAVTADAPAELMTVASVRGRYCEELERRRGGHRRLDAFALGMFSVLGPDGVVADNVLEELPLGPDIKAALRGEPGGFRDLIDIQLAAEQADWETLVAAGRRIGVEPRALAAAHIDALRWATEVKASQSGVGAG